MGQSHAVGIMGSLKPTQYVPQSDIDNILTVMKQAISKAEGKEV